MEIKNLPSETFPPLPLTLTCLTIDDCPLLKKLPSATNELPPSISILTLKNLHLESLENIPSSVQILHILNCRIESIKSLPLTLQTLHVKDTVVDFFYILSLYPLSLKNITLNNTTTNLLALYETPSLTFVQIHNMPSQKFLKRNSSVTNLQLDTTDFTSFHITDVAPNLQTLLLLNTPIKKLDGFPMTLQQCICRGTELEKRNIQIPTFVILKQFVVV